jgi:hypothetical protein
MKVTAFMASHGRGANRNHGDRGVAMPSLVILNLVLSTVEGEVKNLFHATATEV